MNIIPTSEQNALIEIVKTGKNIAVHAGAGAAKTSSCILMANANKKRSLYLAFNASVAKEAKERFPIWVECRTFHSLAYEAVIMKTPFAKKGRLVGYWDKREIANIGELESFEVEDCVTLLDEFCQSKFKTTTEFLLERFQEELSKVELYQTKLAKIWEALINPKNGWKINYSIFLKIWQLSEPRLSDFKTIYLDEFQDTNPVCLDIFLNQQKTSQLIAVGDEAQAIYAWRGAINAFNYIPREDNASWRHLKLTESFRFGENIANKANVVLNFCEFDLKLTGRGVKTAIETQATIVRNNSTLFEILLAAADSKQKVEVIADLKDLYSKLWTLFWIRKSKDEKVTDYGKYPDPYIKGFSDWKEVCESKEPEVAKLRSLLKLCDSVNWFDEKEKKNIFGLRAAIAKANSAIWSEDLGGKQDFTLITGHKSKGLEWDKVILTDDFLPRPKQKESTKELVTRFFAEQGFNLLYVALTRAKVKIEYSTMMESFLNILTEKDYDLFYDRLSLLIGKESDFDLDSDD